MSKIIHIFLLLYYSFGTILLPMGDFSTLQDIPKMYKHCKMTEDVDMTVVDFITDHLINIDGLFDKHLDGDEQKPHKAIDYTFNHSICQIFQEIKNVEFKSIKIIISKRVLIPDYENSGYKHSPIFSIFRPPIFL